MAKASTFLMVLGSKSPESCMFSKQWMISSLCVDSVDGSAVKVPSEVAGCWQSMGPHFIRNTSELRWSRLEKKNGNLRGGLLHDQEELMCISVDKVGFWVHFFYFPLNTCSGTPHHTGSITGLVKPTQRPYKILHSLLFWTVCDDFLSPLCCAF